MVDRGREQGIRGEESRPDPQGMQDASAFASQGICKQRMPFRVCFRGIYDEWDGTARTWLAARLGRGNGAEMGYFYELFHKYVRFVRSKAFFLKLGADRGFSCMLAR